MSLDAPSRRALDAEPAPAPDTPRRYRRLMVPFDGSVQAVRAVEEAAQLAVELRADMKVLLVFDEASHLSGFEPARIAVQEIIPRARRTAAQALEEACAIARAHDVDAEAMLVDAQEADVPDVVDAEARAAHADLVVVGTHGRQGLDRFVLGSVAEAIVRKSSRPVLLVRAP